MEKSYQVPEKDPEVLKKVPGGAKGTNDSVTEDGDGEVNSRAR